MLIEIWVTNNKVTWALNDAIQPPDINKRGFIFKSSIIKIDQARSEINGGSITIIAISGASNMVLTFQDVSAVYDLRNPLSPITHTGLVSNDQLYDIIESLA